MSTITAPSPPPTPIPAPDRPLTLGDALALESGDISYELVDGRLEELNVGASSSCVAGNVIYLLKAHCSQPPVAYILIEQGYTCFPGKPNRMRKPDISLMLADRMTPESFDVGFLPIRPDIAIEVVSPNDLASKLEEKLDDYRDAGIPLVWVVFPSVRRVRVLRLGKIAEDLGPDDTLSGEDILPGFRVLVSDLFAGLPSSDSRAAS